MTDFSLSVELTRDQLVEALTDRLEQTPYVLAEVARRIEARQETVDEFADYLAMLDEDQKGKLSLFCGAVLEDLDEQRRND